MLSVATNTRVNIEENTFRAAGNAPLADKFIRKKLRKRKIRKRLHENEHLPPREGEPIDESEYSLCVLLWQSTIVQALYDLANNGSSAESKLIRAEASSWFFMPKLADELPGNNEFELVCELACLCPERVLKRAREVAKCGEKELEGFNFRTVRRNLSNRLPTKRAARRKKNSNKEGE